MSGLVGYGSSDEEVEDDTAAQRPAKKPKLDHAAPQPTNGHVDVVEAGDGAQPVTNISERPSEHQPPHPEVVGPTEHTALDEPAQTTVGSSGPPPGPSALPLDHEPAGPTLSPPSSPYTSSRQRLRNLTMPSIPNFAIPSSPPPPPTNSEEATTLAQTTKKFERFLTLKTQGVHFNSRLESSTSLQNPSLLPTLMAFAGISEGESYASTLDGGLGVPVEWAEECFVEALLRRSEKELKRRAGERKEVEFVGASAKVVGSGRASKSSTPGGGSAGAPGGKESSSRRSRFDKR